MKLMISDAKISELTLSILRFLDKTSSRYSTEAFTRMSPNPSVMTMTGPNTSLSTGLTAKFRMARRSAIVAMSLQLPSRRTFGTHWFAAKRPNAFATTTTTILASHRISIKYILFRAFLPHQVPEQAFTRHFSGYGNVHELKDGRRDVGKDPGGLSCKIANAGEFFTHKFFAHEIERDRVRVVLCFSRPGHRVHHLFEVAVVGGDDEESAHVAHGFDHAADLAVQHFYGLDRRLVVAAVADRVRIRVIRHDEIERPVLHGLDEPVGDGGRAKFGLFIWMHEVQRRNEHAVFVLIRRFAVAVHEVGDVRVLVGLGNPELDFSGLAHGVSQRLLNGVGEKCGRRRKTVFVAGEGREENVLELLRWKRGECREQESLAQLAEAVFAEIEENDRVVLFDGRAVLHAERGQEFFGEPLSVDVADGLRRVLPA